MQKQILPAYPLFLIDPFFSVYSFTDELNKSDTMYWNGNPRPMYGLVRWDGTTYSFMGSKCEAAALEQTSVSITAFTTDYTFSLPDFSLIISFISPLSPDIV